jgi:hypothetical protein
MSCIRILYENRFRFVYDINSKKKNKKNDLRLQNIITQIRRNKIGETAHVTRNEFRFYSN